MFVCFTCTNFLSSNPLCFASHYLETPLASDFLPQANKLLELTKYLKNTEKR